jgi:hypothetical protein
VAWLSIQVIGLAVAVGSLRVGEHLGAWTGALVAATLQPPAPPLSKALPLSAYRDPPEAAVAPAEAEAMDASDPAAATVRVARPAGSVWAALSRAERGVMAGTAVATAALVAVAVTVPASRALVLPMLLGAPGPCRPSPPPQ